MQKYIFLDIDGVIATDKTIDEAEGTWGLTPEKQELLGRILKATGAKIVLSSSWRFSTVEKTKIYMTEKGFQYSDDIVGVTIRAYQYIEKGIHLSIPRGVEIKQWIDTHVHSDNGKNWNKKIIGKDFNYVILDDDADMLLEQSQFFLRCYGYEGLTETQVEKAIRILNYKKQLPYDEWYAENEERIYIELAETGADRELNYDSEKEFLNRYGKYLDNHLLNNL